MSEYPNPFGVGVGIMSAHPRDVEARSVAANTWNAAVDSISRIVDRHYQGGETAAIKRGLWVYDTDIGSLVRSLRQPLPIPSIPTEKDTP